MGPHRPRHLVPSHRLARQLARPPIRPSPPNPSPRSQPATIERSTTVDDTSRPPPLDDLVLRYLAAYGQATVNDIQAWSGLTRLREVTDRLGARLRPFAGPGGAELLDLPDAPRPDPDVPAPPRFLPEYDNLLLSFADRSRVIRGARQVPLPPGHGASVGTLLVDGFWAAEWRITRGRDRAVLEILPFGPLGALRQDAIGAEGSAPAGVRRARGRA